MAFISSCRSASSAAYLPRQLFAAVEISFTLILFRLLYLHAFVCQSSVVYCGRIRLSGAAMADVGHIVLMCAAQFNYIDKFRSVGSLNDADIFFSRTVFVGRLPSLRLPVGATERNRWPETEEWRRRNNEARNNRWEFVLQ